MLMQEALYSDLLFKEALTHIDNRYALIDFLAALTGFSKEYLSNVDMDVLYESPLTKTKIKDKNFRTDILVKFDNYVINLEMYSFFNSLSLEKSFNYILRIYSTALSSGEKYNSNLKVMQLNIAYKVNLEMPEKLLNEYRIKNVEDDEDKLLEDNILIRIYRLDKLGNKPYNMSEEAFKWLKFISANNNEERKKIAEGSEIFMKFNNWLDDYINDKQAAKIYSEWNRLIDRDTGYYYGEEAGIKAGRKAGMKAGIKVGKKAGILENRKATASKMLKDNISIEDIAKYTDLTKEEIMALED